MIEPIPLHHLSQADLAARWQVAEATLQRWRSEGIGPVYLRLPGRVIYRLSDIEAYEADALRKSTFERAAAGGGQ